jgi:hypothetical protein
MVSASSFTQSKTIVVNNSRRGAFVYGADTPVEVEWTRAAAFKVKDGEVSDTPSRSFVVMPNVLGSTHWIMNKDDVLVHGHDMGGAPHPRVLPSSIPAGCDPSKTYVKPVPQVDDGAALGLLGEDDPVTFRLFQQDSSTGAEHVIVGHGKVKAIQGHAARVPAGGVVRVSNRALLANPGQGVQASTVGSAGGHETTSTVIMISDDGTTSTPATFAGGAQGYVVDRCYATYDAATGANAAWFWVMFTLFLLLIVILVVSSVSASKATAANNTMREVSGANAL